MSSSRRSLSPQSESAGNATGEPYRAPGCGAVVGRAGSDGFVGVKTGSDDAAGRCFAFRAIRWIDGKQTTITGVVLGQPGHDRIAAGLAAADAPDSATARKLAELSSTSTRQRVKRRPPGQDHEIIDVGDWGNVPASGDE